MKVLITHPTANQNVRAAAVGMLSANILHSFNTTIALFPGDLLDKIASYGTFGALRKRSFDADLRSRTRSWPWYEVGRLLALKTGARSATAHEKGMFCIDMVYRHLDRSVAQALTTSVNNVADTAYAYEDGALETFRAAKQLGMRCVYDLPIGYWRAGMEIFNAERQRMPEWAPTLTGLQNSPAKLSRKDEEIGLADIIYVASRFTAETLKQFQGPLASIEVIPYGFPDVAGTRTYSSSSGPLRLLFVGGLTQRKGIAYLFDAVRKFPGHVELTIVGQKPALPCPALDAELKKIHRYIPALSHADTLNLMRRHDVLVFPSLFEGFGLVITEAMSQGTPVITTPRTAGPDLISTDENGWIIDAGSTEAICTAIEKILVNRMLVINAGRSAMEAARRRPWSVYGQELVQSLLRTQRLKTPIELQTR